MVAFEPKDLEPEEKVTINWGEMECVVRLGWKASPRSPWKLPFLGPTVIKVLWGLLPAAGPS